MYINLHFQSSSSSLASQNNLSQNVPLKSVEETREVFLAVQKPWDEYHHISIKVQLDEQIEIFEKNLPDDGIYKQDTIIKGLNVVVKRAFAYTDIYLNEYSKIDLKQSKYQEIERLKNEIRLLEDKLIPDRKKLEELWPEIKDFITGSFDDMEREKNYSIKYNELQEKLQNAIDNDTLGVSRKVPYARAAFCFQLINELQESILSCQEKIKDLESMTDPLDLENASKDMFHVWKSYEILILEDRLTIYHFNELNRQLAKICQEMRPYLDPVSARKDPKNIKKAYAVLSQYADFPVCIVYLNPKVSESGALMANRDVGYLRFIEAFCKGKHPKALAVFDCHSRFEHAKTKKDSHYSNFQGTYTFLMHDFLHAFEQSTLYKNCPKIVTEIKHLFNAFILALESQDTLSLNEAKIVEHLLFCLVQDILPLLTKAINYGDMNDPVLLALQRIEKESSILPSLINYVSAEALSILNEHERDDESYKINYRDWEKYLYFYSNGKKHYLVGADGVAFFPLPMSYCTAEGRREERPFPIVMKDAFARIVDHDQSMHKNRSQIYPNGESVFVTKEESGLEYVSKVRQTEIGIRYGINIQKQRNLILFGKFKSGFQEFFIFGLNIISKKIQIYSY